MEKLLTKTRNENILIEKYEELVDSLVKVAQEINLKLGNCSEECKGDSDIP